MAHQGAVDKPEQTGEEIMEANSQGDFENILICMDLE
jgi:hypothetical protein